MKKILESLFDGSLLVQPVREKRSPKHQKACEASYTLLEELAEKLNTEEKGLLDKAVNALDDANEYYTMDRFVRGYCLGALMMMEIMEKREDLF